MRIVRRADAFQVAADGAVLLLGDFDGFHEGLQELVRRACAEAVRRNRPLVAIDIPCGEVNRQPIIPLRASSRLMMQAGIGCALVFPDWSQPDVLRWMRRSRPDTVFVWGGPVAVESSGALRTMIEAWEEAGIAVRCFVESRFGLGAGRTAGDDIRRALAEGRPADVARLIGRYWSVEARVEHGDARGRTIGFPTANMRLRGCLWPAFGTYAVRVAIPGVERWYDGMANFGIRPTYHTVEPRLETHIFDFDGDLYGKRLAVELVEWLRPERKFPSLETLVAQLKADALKTRKFLRTAYDFRADPEQAAHQLRSG